MFCCECEFIYQNVDPFRKSACVYGKMLYKYRDLAYFTRILPSAPPLILSSGHTHAKLATVQLYFVPCKTYHRMSECVSD